MRHEAVPDLCSSWPGARRVLAAADDHRDVGILEPPAERRRGRKAVCGVRQDAAVQLSVRYPADADDGGGG